MLCEALRRLLDKMRSTKSRATGGLVESNIKSAKSRMLRNLNVLHDKLYNEESQAADDIRDALEVEEVVPFALKIEDLQWMLLAEIEFAKVMLESFQNHDEVLLYMRRLTTKKSSEGWTRSFYMSLYDQVSKAAKEGFGFEVEFSKVLLDVCAGQERGQAEGIQVRRDVPDPVKMAANAEGVGLVLRGLGAASVVKAFEGLWAFQEGRHLFRVGALDLSSIDQTIESRSELELQRALQLPDPIHDLSISLSTQINAIRGLVEKSVEAEGYEVRNSDELTLRPRCMVPLELENPQVNDLGRRLVLDWLLVDRCGIEVAE